MKTISTLILLLTLAFTSSGQNYNYPGDVEIKGFKIGDKVDTSLFKKYGDV